MNIKDKLVKLSKKVTVYGLVAVMSISGSVALVHAGDYTDDLLLKYNDNIYKYQQRLITVEIDGQELQTGDMPAVLIENTTMVPVREVFESQSINATVNWNGATQQIFVAYEDKFIVLTIDSKTAYVNNEPVELIVPPMLIQDMGKQYPKTMIPLRFVSESIGFDVDWDGDTFTALISTGKNVSNPAADTDTATPPDTGEEAPDDNDTVKDPTIVSGEQLDKLEGTKANRALPTALASESVVFNPVDTLDVETEIDASYSEADIEEKDYDDVYIDDIDYYESEEAIGFEIDATGPISAVSTHVWDGKFIVEIANSSLDLSNSTIEYTDNPIVTAVRTGTHEDEEGDDYSKIVFDLKASGYKFNLELNDDRDRLQVKAVNNSIYEVELSQNDTGDYIDITGVNATVVEAFRLSNPSRIVFDMPNTKTLLGYQEGEAEGQYVTAIRTAQFDSTTSRIVVETDGQPDYQVIEVSDNVTRIQILEPTYENISYDNTEDKPTIIIDENDEEDLTIDTISYKDNYLDREYIITLPGDYTDHFGTGKVNINDAVIDDISFELDSNNNTEVIIQAKSVHEFRVEETDKGLTIKAYKPAELYEKVIVVDAGHGGDDPGAVIGSYFEKETTLGTTLELKKLLDGDSDMKVYYTRLDDTRPSLYERTDLANEVEADFFLSIHCNSFTSNFNGVETLYLPGPNTPDLNAFELAEIFQEVFSENVEIDNYLAKERDNLHVLNATEMPAIILEMGYLSNSHDREYLTDSAYFDDLAYAIKLAIDETFEQHPTGR